MADLTILRGGADPAELAQLEDQATEAMGALADALPRSDRSYEAISAVSEILRLRKGRRDFRADRARIKEGRLPEPTGPRRK